MSAKPAKPKQRSTAKKPTKNRPAPVEAHSPVPRSQWKLHLKELAAFRRQHGHCNVPRRYPPNRRLASWVATVRRRKKNGRLSPELVRRLDRIGFLWSVGRKVWEWRWITMLSALKDFKERHGHMRVPCQRPEYRRINRWLRNARVKKRQGLLDRHRVEQLEALGVEWEPYDQRWEKMFAALVQYKKRFGDCEVPGNWPEDSELAHWVKLQRYYWRQRSLNAKRMKRLQQLGVTWVPKRDQWALRCRELAEFRRVHGHCRVSTLDKQYSSLGNWVRTQRGRKRRDLLMAEQVRQLEELGFEWDGRMVRAEGRE